MYQSCGDGMDDDDRVDGAHAAFVGDESSAYRDSESLSMFITPPFLCSNHATHCPHRSGENAHRSSARALLLFENGGSEMSVGNTKRERAMARSRSAIQYQRAGARWTLPWSGCHGL